MKFDSILDQQIAYCCGVEVDMDKAFNTVVITELVENDSMKKEIFLQGDDADNFIKQVEELQEKYCDEFEDHAFIVAYPYMDLLTECEPVNI